LRRSVLNTIIGAPGAVADAWWKVTSQEEEATGAEREGRNLYLLTLGLELVLSASARWLVAYLCILGIGAWIPLGVWTASLPWLLTVTPLVWSVAALAHVGKPRTNRRRRERPLTYDEDSQMLGAMAEIWINDPDIFQPRKVRVLDVPGSYAAVSGDTVVVSLETLNSLALPAVLAHELSHLNSSDPWLRMALSRLGRDHSVLNFLRFDELRGAWKLLAIVAAPVRWLLRLASGGIGRTMLCGAWSKYWLAREFVSDAHAASLGQGRLLAAYLTASSRGDNGIDRLLEAMTNHPSVEERLERLDQLIEVGSRETNGASDGSAQSLQVAS
jgi:Zn-dependent protease with chaperone function